MALTYSAVFIPTSGFVTYLFDGEMQSWLSGLFWVKAAGHFLTGTIVGVVAWASMERQYEEALHDGRIAAAIEPPRDHALPQNSKFDFRELPHEGLLLQRDDRNISERH